jgi:hypothetical protein
MTLDPTILLLLGLATTFVIAVRKPALGGRLAMLATPLWSLAIDPINVAPLVAFLEDARSLAS